MPSFKFLGIKISEDLKWSVNSAVVVKKAQQRLYFLRTLRKAHLSAKLLESFYRCSVESILTYCITAWFGNCSAADRAALQRVIKTAQGIIGLPLPPLEDIYHSRCRSRTCNIVKDITHPCHHLFTLLPSGKRYRSLKSRTARLKNSFYPSAILELNSVSGAGYGEGGGGGRQC